MNDPGVVTVERVRFTLLARGRPLVGRAVVVGAPPGCRLGLELDRVEADEDRAAVGHPFRRTALAFRIGVTVSSAPDGPPADEVAAPPDVLALAALDVQDGLRRLAGDLRGPEWSIEAWASGDGLGPGTWLYVCAPWTTQGGPVLDHGTVRDPGDPRSVDAVRFWRAQTRAGAAPWPEDWPAVHSARGVVQVRPDTYWYRAVVDLPPPEADVLPRSRARAGG
ncbi:hypothetical protein ACFY0G_02225 [Streptomyces sp. NPDC001552]|uniref:hypothetical protein n=1 Tax=Streptomyces sp. NPDC001552 TaxID=3364587 RepID=UPI00368E72B7